MHLNCTYLFKRLLGLRYKIYPGILLVIFCFVLNTQNTYAADNDSTKNKRPSIVSDLQQCRVPAFMITAIKHMTPAQMLLLDEEYQQMGLADDGEEVMITVKLRFIEDHIVGYIKESPPNNTNNFKIINYIDIPIEWMCIQPKQDHPFHFSSSIKELDAIKEENGCLGWQQRDSGEPLLIHSTNEKTKKKRNTKNVKS